MRIAQRVDEIARLEIADVGNQALNENITRHEDVRFTRHNYAFRGVHAQGVLPCIHAQSQCRGSNTWPRGAYREQRIRCDVEGHAEAHVTGALPFAVMISAKHAPCTSTLACGISLITVCM